MNYETLKASPIGQKLLAAGYDIWNSGGNVMVWGREAKNGVIIYIGQGDSDIGEDGDETKWGTCCSDKDGGHIEWLTFEGTLDEMIEKMSFVDATPDKLPAPGTRVCFIAEWDIFAADTVIPRYAVGTVVPMDGDFAIKMDVRYHNLREWKNEVHLDPHSMAEDNNVSEAGWVLLHIRAVKDDERFICSCGWFGSPLMLRKGKCPVTSCRNDVTLLPPINMAGFPSAEVIGAEFVKVLREWINDSKLWDGEYAHCESPEEAWAHMCKLNAADHDRNAEQEFCDANMAMDEAMRNLGMGAALDHPAWADDQRMTDLWNKAWECAKPALRGEVPTVTAKSLLADAAAMKDLTDDVINALALLVQQRIGQEDGGIAGIHFSDSDKREEVESLLRSYLETEAAYED